MFEASWFHDFKVLGLRDMLLYVYMYIAGPEEDPHFIGLEFTFSGILVYAAM